MFKVLITLSVLLGASSAIAEDTISCDGGSTELVLQDDGAIRFSSKEVSRRHRIVEQTPHLNARGVQTGLDLLIDDGADSYKTLFKFKALDECEGDSFLEIEQVPFMNTPRLLKTLMCECTQS